MEALREDLEGGEEVLLGTMDTWLVYQLIRSLSSEEGAGNIGRMHITNVTNTFRWLFFDLHTLRWDTTLIEAVF